MALILRLEGWWGYLFTLKANCILFDTSHSPFIFTTQEHYHFGIPNTLNKRCHVHEGKTNSITKNTPILRCNATPNADLPILKEDVAIPVHA